MSSCQCVGGFCKRETIVNIQSGSRTWTAGEGATSHESGMTITNTAQTDLESRFETTTQRAPQSWPHLFILIHIKILKGGASQPVCFPATNNLLSSTASNDFNPVQRAIRPKQHDAFSFRPSSSLSRLAKSTVPTLHGVVLPAIAPNNLPDIHASTIHTSTTANTLRTFVANLILRLKWSLLPRIAVQSGT